MPIYPGGFDPKGSGIPAIEDNKGVTEILKLGGRTPDNNWNAGLVGSGYSKYGGGGGTLFGTGKNENPMNKLALSAFIAALSGGVAGGDMGVLGGIRNNLLSDYSRGLFNQGQITPEPRPQAPINPAQAMSSNPILSALQSRMQQQQARKKKMGMLALGILQNILSNRRMFGLGG